jgi:tetratricopeptide (TPR) repeat protein
MPEDFGVVLRDGRTVPLIAAGTPLPFPDADGTHDVHDDGAPFAVPTDDAATLLVPYYTGTEALWRLAGTVKVPLEDRVPAGTPVRITVRVEEDKTLKWWFRIGDGEARLAPSVDDPWTSRALDADEKRLREVRRAIRDAIAQGRPVTHRLLVEEANSLRLAGALDSALLAIEDILADDGSDGHAHNVHGLVLGDMERYEESVKAYATAAQRSPGVPTFLSNMAFAMQLTAHPVESCIALLRLAIEKDPTAAYTYVALGAAYRRSGDEARALVEYRRALSLLKQDVERRPFDRGSWTRLRNVYQSLGEYRLADQAREVVERIDRDALYDGDSRHVIAGATRQPITAGAE